MTQLKTYAVRLPETAIEDLKEVAQTRYIPTRTMIRAWIMQRLEAERMNRIPVVGAELGGTTPITGGHQTPVGADADV